MRVRGLLCVVCDSACVRPFARHGDSSNFSPQLRTNTNYSIRYLHSVNTCTVFSKNILLFVMRPDPVMHLILKQKKLRLLLGSQVAHHDNSSDILTRLSRRHQYALSSQLILLLSLPPHVDAGHRGSARVRRSRLDHHPRLQPFPQAISASATFWKCESVTPNIPEFPWIQEEGSRA